MKSSRSRPLGVGLTYFPVFQSFIRDRASLIDAIEVSPETLLLEDGNGGYVCDKAELDFLAGFPVPKVIHGVSNPVGGTAPADPARLDSLSAVAELFGSDLASEHLSFARVPGEDGYQFTGFMLPPRQTARGVEVAAGTARALADSVKIPFAIENGVSYLRRRADEMPDGEFLASVAEAADVGILLDLHNAYANERNGRGSMADFVAALPLDRVVEIHLAGGLPQGDYWLDAHSGAIPDAVFGFARELAGSLPNLRLVNFELLPLYFAQFGPDGVTRELGRCHEVWEARHEPRWHSPGPTLAARLRADSLPEELVPPAAWERQLAALVGGCPPATASDDDLGADPGIEVLRFLVSEFRAGSIARGLKLTVRLLLIELGERAVRGICTDFFVTSPPELFAAAESSAFASYLLGLDLQVPHLRSVVSFELALQRSCVQGGSVEVAFEGDPEDILARLARGQRPPPPAQPPRSVVVESASGLDT